MTIAASTVSSIAPGLVAITCTVAPAFSWIVEVVAIGTLASPLPVNTDVNAMNRVSVEPALTVPNNARVSLNLSVSWP